MTHKEFCENCRFFYEKKIYNEKTLDAFVKKGKLSQEERDCIVNSTPFPWEEQPIP